jgi:hypothetical protein
MLIAATLDKAYGRDALTAGAKWGGRALKAASRLAAGAALAALLALSGPSGANDSIANLETGGLVLIKNTDVEMRSEDLYISDKAVRVKYVFMNTSPKDVTVTVAFPMPDIAWDAAYVNTDIPAAGANFLAFTTTVDGKPVKVQVEQKAMDQNGVDRSAYLLGIGVPLDTRDPATNDDALNRLPKAQQDAVVKLGLAAWPDEGVSAPHKLSARWTLKTTFFWQQTFPAGRAVAVEHNYIPSLGQAYDFGWGAWGSAPGSPEGAAFLAEKYCVDDAFVAAFKKTRPSDSKLPFGEEFIDYVLVTGANWKAPIGDFHIVIDKGAPANLVSFCGTGVRKIGPTTYEVHHANFTPTSNVSVLILNPNWRFPGGAPTAEAQGISTPQTGNPERTAVLDGLRRYFGDGSLRFVVKTLNVAHADKGAIAYTEATTAKGIGGVFLLTSDARGMWKMGWSEGQGTSDCATVANSFASAKVLIESYGIKPDALIPDFAENNYNSLQQQARQHPHGPCGFSLVGDPGELSHKAASQDYEVRVAQFHAAQKKRLQSAVPIVWRELTVGSADTNNFLKRYPYLKEYLDGLESGTPVSIAESRAPANKKAGVNLLFVVIEGQMNCGTGGCAFSIYANSGTGYKEVANFLEFPVQARVSRTADGGVSVFLPFIHKHAPNPDEPPEGTYFEYTFKGNSLEKTEPPKQPPG